MLGGISIGGPGEFCSIQVMVLSCWTLYLQSEWLKMHDSVTNSHSSMPRADQ